MAKLFPQKCSSIFLLLSMFKSHYMCVLCVQSKEITHRISKPEWVGGMKTSQAKNDSTIHFSILCIKQNFVEAKSCSIRGSKERCQKIQDI